MSRPRSILLYGLSKRPVARQSRACQFPRDTIRDGRNDMTHLKGNTFFEGPAGRIEAILKEPAAAVTRAAVVCHPHPLFGGTMHNKVVFRIARVFEEARFAVLRFNFRGAGRSEGVHDNGRGEQADLTAAINFIEGKYPNTELWLAGFSFGAAIALRVGCEDDRVASLIAAGLPTSMYDFSELGACSKPKLFVQGSHDEFGPVGDLSKLYELLRDPKALKIIDAAGHFFEGCLGELALAIEQRISSCF